MSSIPEKQYLQTSADMEMMDTAALRERPRSCSGVSSDLSVSSSLSGTPSRPLSTSSGGSPSYRTLVQPRPWRILHRSRISSSLERERAMEEDTSLEGDEDRNRKGGGGEDEAGSSVDGDLVIMRRRENGSKEKLQEANGGGSSVDAVVRTKSESDIAIHKVISNGDAPRMVVFKSKAERFSVKEDKPAQQRTSALSKSQTLPLSLPSKLLAAAAGYSGSEGFQNTAPTEKSSTQTPLSSLAKSTPSTGHASTSPTPAEKTKSVPLPEPDPSEAEDRRHSLHVSSSPSGDRRNMSGAESEDAGVSLSKSNRSSGIWDSPSRSITLNTQDSSARLSLCKPDDSIQPVTLDTSPGPEQPVKATELQVTSAPKSSDRPQVPTKPARRSSLNSATPSSGRSMSLPSSPARAAGTSQGPPKPPRTTLDKPRRNSSSLASPKTPMETVLFSMGFTVVDDSQTRPASKQNLTAARDSQPKPNLDVCDSPETEEKAQTGDTIVPRVAHLVQQAPESESECEVFTGNGEAYSRMEQVPVHQETPPSTDTEPIIVHDIVAKKMTKIKCDKKADEKAAKARKKEQKAKEKEMKAKEKEMKAKEKEMKAKMKAAAKDEAHHEKGRGKLFPWKVEFSSTKGKGPASEETVVVVGAPMTKEDAVSGDAAAWRGVTDGGEQRVGGPVPVEPPTPPPLPEDVVIPEVDSSSASEATSKRTDKGDGTTSTSSSRSPSDKSQEQSPSTPSPEKDDHTRSPQSPQDEPEPPQQLQQEQQQQQQQLQQSPSSPSRAENPAQPPSSSSSPVHGVEPHHPHPPQPSPQQPRREVSSSPPRSPPRYYADDLSSSDPSSDMDSLSGSLRRKVRQERTAPPAAGLSVSESDGEATSPDSSGQGRRPGSRRHTVGGAQIRDQMQTRDDTDRKREAFYELLATRYPEYADKITGMASPQPTTAAERNPRPRESQRRRTTVVTYNPQSSRLLDQDDVGTMSDVEPSAFQRGGVARASLPIVRSASSSLERPIGLVFLMFGEETKKSLLPNEITSLDTVRALFVRAFPDKLSMEFLDSPKRKIYILEAATNIFFQLEDLRDIQDRTVLKIHECDSEEPQRVRSHPESRGRAVQQVTVQSRPVSRQGYASDGSGHYDIPKAQSLPVSQNYQEMMHKERAQWEMEQEYIQAQHRRSRSRSQTPELAERPRSLSTGAPRNRYSHSPERLSTPERGPQSLNPIPENPRLLANGFRQAALNGSHYEVLPGSRAHPQHPPPGHPHSAPPGRVLSPPTVAQPIYESVYHTAAHGYHHPQSYVTHSMRAAMPQGPQRATGPTPLDMRAVARNDPGGRHSLAFAAMSNPIYESFPQRTQSYRAAPERELMPPRPQSAAPHEAHRMERMEAQIATLAAWVHQVHASPTESARRGPGSSRSTSSGHSEGTDTYPGSSASSLSDIPATYSLRQPVVSQEMREKMHDMRCRLKEFRVELQGLKRMEQLNQETMRDTFSEALFRIQKVTGISGKLDETRCGLQKLSCNLQAQAYMQDRAKVEHDLRGLELQMEGLKDDILTRKCHVNVTDIEGQALQLTHITKSLADLKARCPQVHEALKSGSTAETQDANDQFLSEESSYIEAALKRCKTLTNNLVTLKRIATAQDSSSSPGPSLPVECKSEDEEDTMAILENLRAMVPDYEARIRSLEGSSSQSSRSETGTRRSSTSAEGMDSPKCEPPQVPAKPARLLSASEIKQMGAIPGSGDPAASSTSHTVTVTSQITDHNDNAIPADRHSARSAFFSSMQSPPTSPLSLSDSSRSSRKLPSTSRVGTVSSGSTSLSPPPASSSSSSSLTSPSHSKLVSGVYYQAVSPTRTRSAFSSIPLPNKPPSDKEDSSKMSDKGKKVPPPPPPRTSSAKLSYGASPNSNGSGAGGRRNSGDKSPDARKKDSTLSVFKPSSPTSPGPKPGMGQKTMNKFQKDIAAGIYANLNRPDLQHQNMAPDRVIGSMATPAPAAVVTNSQDPQEEGELSGSESTGSSTSLDSQQGVALMRANSAASSRGPKPNPPQRHSSLSSRGSFSEESGNKTKTQMLQERVRKSQEAGNRRASGSGSSQVNGMDSTRNGHKT